MNREKIKRFVSDIRIVFNRMSLRTRLFLAFVILIVSSASATIFIGVTVFTNKVEELAYSKVAVDLKLVEHIYNSIAERLRLFCRLISEKEDPIRMRDSFFEASFMEIPPDFLILKSGDNNLYFLRRPNRDDISKDFEPLDSELLPATLREFIRYLDEQGSVISSNLIIRKEESSNLFDLKRDLLVMVSGIKNSAGVIVICGIEINYKSELADRLRALASSLGNQNYQISIFLGDRRVLTTIGSEAIDSQADRSVSEVVLRNKRVFVGRPRVLNTVFFAAYSPLLNYKGDVIGMLGIGTPEEVYGDVRKRTSALFAGLIVAGMIFGFIMTFLFSLWLVKPVERLADAMDRVAQGDYNYKVRIESVNEIVRLSKSFNAMLKAIKERDLKLQEMTEERLSRVEKQVSIGRLAAGVAHEINNPLTAILSLSSLMLKHLPEGDPRAEDLKIIVEETTRCKNIVKSLLDFARERPMEKEIADLNEIVKSALALTEKYDSMSSVETVLKLCDHPLYVYVDPKQIQQVIVNLLINAAEACDSGGRIEIITSEDFSSGFANVIVIDNGKGIPKEHINRVFEPFFTTKGSGKGTGLGLSVSLGIIRKHDGTIEIESTEGKGTRVTVVLPMQEP